MAGPLAGIKVVEMGVWVAGPSCAAILADWGAEVIKIEPPEGDPFRGLGALLGASINPPFELDNRGKRSIALNLAVEDARNIAGDLIDAADVFVSNMRPGALERLGMTYEKLSDTNPGLIYCNVTGYGPETPEANRAAYDVGAFWARAGVVMGLTPEGASPPLQRGGMGDHMTGANAAGAISAALFNREKTGRGQRVAVSLTRIGVYMMGWDTNTQLRTGMPYAPPADRFHAPNPLINPFQDKDGHWFYLLMLQGDRHWPDFLRALGNPPELADDERFRDIPNRFANAPLLVGILDRMLATKPLAEWGPVFDSNDVWWAPIQNVTEVVQDPVVRAAGAFVTMDGPDGPVEQVNTPVDFYGTPTKPGEWAPELGQHTETILLEDLGYDWDRIASLKELGAIP
ncbi:MAG: CoA transferase [Dehalococcoidia bacterium]|nr:CoA transferase [Dehalococcoidia bacterium]